MKDNRDVRCAVIIAIAIVAAGLLISNAIDEGFKNLGGAISYAGEILR